MGVGQSIRSRREFQLRMGLTPTRRASSVESARRTASIWFLDSTRSSSGPGSGFRRGSRSGAEGRRRPRLVLMPQRNREESIPPLPGLGRRNADAVVDDVGRVGRRQA